MSVTFPVDCSLSRHHFRSFPDPEEYSGDPALGATPYTDEQPSSERVEFLLAKAVRGFEEQRMKARLFRGLEGTVDA